MGVNPKKKPVAKKCGYCNQCAGHKIDRCPLRQEFKRLGMEYEISNSLTSKAVVSSIENGMNVAGVFQMHETDKYFSELQQSWYRMHVILRGLYLPHELSQQKRSMINLFFKISLINENAMIDVDTDNIFVSGHTMNRILINVGKKKKFIYDCT